MTHVTCRLSVKNRDQLRNRVLATFFSNHKTVQPNEILTILCYIFLFLWYNPTTWT